MQFEYFQQLANGAAIPGISRGDVLDLKILMPSEEQQSQVMSMIDEISLQEDQLEIIYRHQTEALSELKQSILLKAFSGPVQVKGLDREAAE